MPVSATLRTLRPRCAGICKQVGVDRGKLLKYVGAGDYDIQLLEPGILYRDCWPVDPSGNQHLDSRERAESRMRFRTSDGYTLQHIVRRTYPRPLWTNLRPAFQDELGWPVDSAGE
jgi:hypothetical protein